MDYLGKTKLTLFDQIIVSTVGGVMAAIILAIVVYFLKDKLWNWYQLRKNPAALFKEHPRYSEFQGYVIEKRTKNIYPYLRITTSYDLKNMYSVLKEDGKEAPIHASDVIEYEVFDWSKINNQKTKKKREKAK